MNFEVGRRKELAGVGHQVADEGGIVCHKKKDAVMAMKKKDLESSQASADGIRSERTSRESKRTF